MMKTTKWLLSCAVLFFSSPLHAQEQGTATDLQSRLDKVLEQAGEGFAAAPSIPFTAKEGNKTLQDFQGDVVLLNFWATWCPPCIKEMPMLEQLSKDYADEPFEVVAVSIDFKGFETAESFLTKHNIKLTTYADRKTRLYDSFSADGLPFSVLIDRKGNIRERFNGFFDWSSPEMRAKIDNLL